MQDNRCRFQGIAGMHLSHSTFLLNIMMKYDKEKAYKMKILEIL